MILDTPIYKCTEKTPKNYEHVIVICDENIVVTAQYINGIYETDNPDMYASSDPNFKMAKAITLHALYWIPSDKFAEIIQTNIIP